jgi:hypothetical protein
MAKVRRGDVTKGRLLRMRRFFNEATGPERPLSPLAMAVWCWLMAHERYDQATAGYELIKRVWGLNNTGVHAVLTELQAGGYLEVRDKGRRGERCTTYRLLPQLSAEDQAMLDGTVPGGRPCQNPDPVEGPDDEV